MIYVPQNNSRIENINNIQKNLNMYILQNTEWAIQNRINSETGNLGYTRRRQAKQKHNIICVGHHHT